jgi:type IV pilus assembly protein PilY1
MVKKLLILGITCFIFSFPGIIRAEDTEIFGGSQINVPPNVLIIFDSSGSMAENVTIPAATEYDKNTTYTGSYDLGYVYRQQSWGWEQFQDIGVNHIVDSGEISCDSARDALNEYGHFQGQIQAAAPHACGTSYTAKNLRTGNYLNYYVSEGPQTRPKIDIAKETISDVIDTTNGVRFGLMVFNYSEGGRLMAPCADRDSPAQKQALKDTINGFSANGWTPLAETLAEAGLYFARQPSYFNSGVNYGTPSTYGGTEHVIQWRCQKNYIIIMTDGESTQDRNAILTAANYMYSKSIGDYDSDVSATDPTKHQSEYYWIDSSSVQHAYPDSGSDYLDDVAKFLYDEDLLPASVYDSGGISFNNTDFPTQHIITYTIGFDTDHKLLLETSDAMHGQGDYFTTSSTISLSDILEKIIGRILESNSQFVAPVVPVNRMNRTYADNGIYLGIFAPDSYNPGLWMGNIKKFGFSKTGEVLDRDGNVATNSDGSIKDGAHSAWLEVTGTEGMTVHLGGAGTVMMTQASRNFKTYKAGTGPGTGNIVFNTTNVQPSDLGLTTTDERDDLVNFVTASGIYAPDYSGSGGKPRTWILGDIIHSQPAILYDRTNNKNVILVGANDGFLHCFVDSDQGTSENLTDDTVEEAWAFAPWDILPNLKYLPSLGTTNFITGDTNHDYFIDGSPVTYKTGGNTYLAFGLRRGGKNISTGSELQSQYFILDVSTYTSPAFTASIAKNILGTELLGQSWSTPHFCKIRETGGSTMADVLLLAGGYDTNQDNANPGTADSKGRAVFTVNAASGTLANTNLNLCNYTNYNKMRYSMVDFMSFDEDDDGCDDVMYAPSVGGDLFVFESKKHTDGTYDGVWSRRLLFQAAPQDASTSKLRKFLYAPEAALETWGDYVYIGSGDRENPSGTNVVNRFYAIRNTWPSSWDDNDPITDSDLTDETADVLQGTASTPSAMTEEEKAQYRSTLASATGWFFDLELTGEKVVSQPLVYNKVVYFTTYSPTSTSSAGEDLCETGAGSGTGRFYAVDYKTGEAVFENFDGDPTKLTKEDRFISLGSGIPSQPSLVVTEQGTFVVVGTESGVKPFDTNDIRFMTRYYWLKQ